MSALDLKKINKIHFVGIGGIGISAIARMMLGQGKSVSGSDVSDSALIAELKSLGARIAQGHDTSNLPEDADLLVYTIAMREDNPEFREAKRLGIRTITYPEMLGVISNGKYTIAIAGTHGKTTTTAMVAKIFQEAGKSPTVIVGSLLGEGRSNFVAGESEFFIVEACEYKRSFLNLSPRILVITNIDNDHLDYYGSLDGVQKAFREMCKCVPEDGVIVTDVLNETVKSVLAGLKCRIVDYQQEDISALRLKIPGEHNRNNARAAVAVAREVNITNELACRALETFAGTWRRFEYKGATRNATLIYDDYAHHPTEIQATLGGARELFPDKTITVIFQPHLYSRTKGLVGDFAVAFVGADNLLLAPIYSARESFDPSISSEILAKKVSGVPGIIKAFKDMASLEDFIKEDIENSDVIITMGAGDIYKAGENILVKDKNTKPVTVPR